MAFDLWRWALRERGHPAKLTARGVMFADDEDDEEETEHRTSNIERPTSNATAEHNPSPISHLPSAISHP